MLLFLLGRLLLVGDVRPEELDPLRECYRPEQLEINKIQVLLFCKGLRQIGNLIGFFHSRAIHFCIVANKKQATVTARGNFELP